jgi:hypothetical protein
VWSECQERRLSTWRVGLELNCQIIKNSGVLKLEKSYRIRLRIVWSGVCRLSELVEHVSWKVLSDTLNCFIFGERREMINMHTYDKM